MYRVFNVHGSVHRKNILIYVQQDATLHSLFYVVIYIQQDATLHSLCSNICPTRRNVTQFMF